MNRRSFFGRIAGAVAAVVTGKAAEAPMTFREFRNTIEAPDFTMEIDWLSDDFPADWICQIYAEKMMVALDEQMLSGDGASPPTGAICGRSPVKSAWDDLTADESLQEAQARAFKYGIWWSNSTGACDGNDRAGSGRA